MSATRNRGEGAPILPPGAAVTVYVNPEGAGDDNFMTFAAVFGGLCLLAGAVLYFGTSAR